MAQNQKHGTQQIYYVSDRTGKTAELNGESLLSQFPGLVYESSRFPFVDENRIEDLARLIERLVAAGGPRPIVFSSLVDPKLRIRLAASGAHIFDLYEDYLDPLERILDRHSNFQIGIAHEGYEERETSDYQRRTQALEFTLSHDDGLHPRHYDRADVIVVGVSRSAKTPVCLYLAMNFFVRAANFPLTGEDLDDEQLPTFLRDKKERVVGLHIDPDRLHAIREKRRPNSKYSSLRNCQQEVRRADEIYKISNIPIYDSSTTSIEEIAVGIVKKMDLLH